MALESGIKDRIVQALRKRGYYARRMPSNYLTGAGFPDIMVLLKVPAGRALFLEAKQPSKHPTKLQQATLDQLQRHGARVAVVYNTADALKAVVDNESNP